MRLPGEETTQEEVGLWDTSGRTRQIAIGLEKDRAMLVKAYVIRKGRIEDEFSTPIWWASYYRRIRTPNLCLLRHFKPMFLSSTLASNMCNNSNQNTREKRYHYQKQMREYRGYAGALA
jgi:hypothetical protein